MIPSMRVIAAVGFISCPVHGDRVAHDEHGHLLGKCQRCMYEAARALRLIAGKAE